MSQRRVYQNKYPYFITTKTINNIYFFDDQKFAQELYTNIIFCVGKYKAILFSYCIMPDHLHLLIKFSQQNDISDFIRDIKSLTVKRVRENFGYCGKMWQKRFYEKVINDKHRFVVVKKYIINNPVKAGLQERYKYKPYQ